MVASLSLAGPEDAELSPRWLRTIGIVMVLGFGVLIAITVLAYRNASPIPARVIDAQDATLFTGQAVFLIYELMDNGSIWGHGAYLGPDYSADALHRMGEDTAPVLAQQQFGKPVVQLDAMQTAALHSEAAVT